MYSCLVIKSILLFLIILPFFVAASSNQQNYCDITCKKSSKVYKHTMCVNKGCPIKGMFESNTRY